MYEDVFVKKCLSNLILFPLKCARNIKLVLSEISKLISINFINTTLLLICVWRFRESLNDSMISNALKNYSSMTRN